MGGVIDLGRARELIRTRQANAFIALADQLEGGGAEAQDVVAGLLMASIHVLAESTDPDEALKMARGVAACYPEMVESILVSRRKL